MVYFIVGGMVNNRTMISKGTNVMSLASSASLSFNSIKKR